MTHTQKAIGFVVGVIILLVAFNLLFNRPASRRLEQLREEAETIDRRIAGAGARLRALPGIEKRIAESRKELDRLGVQFPRSVESVYKTITDAARATGFKISRRETSERIDNGESLRVFEINIVGYSPYRVLGEFLDSILSSPVLISVSSLAVSSEVPIGLQVENADLRVEMRLTTYLSKDGGGAFRDLPASSKLCRVQIFSGKKI